MTDDKRSPYAESAASSVPPDAEKLLQALDHLDAAYNLAKSVDAQVCSHIHLARVEAERHTGAIIFAHERRQRRAHNDGYPAT